MRKGQEEAPIEVLIGVTVLTFVIIIGMHLFQSQCSTLYESKMSASFSQFARELEFVYLGSVGTSLVAQVDFSPPMGCSGLQIKSINLVQGVSGPTCRLRTGREDCMQLVAFLAPEQGIPGEQVLISEFIDISSNDVVIEGRFGSCSGNDLALRSYGSNFDCSFASSFNTFKLTKEGPDKIVISDFE